MPTYTWAWSYTTYYQVTAANYNTKTWSITTTISKANQTVTVSNATVTASCPTTTTFTASTNGWWTLSVTSSDTSVATVSISNGTVTVTPKKAWNATITVTAAQTANYKTWTKEVSLTVNRWAQTVTLNKSSLSLTYPNTNTFTASTVANGWTLSVSSATTSVATATISNGTVTVTPVKVGTSNITVTAARTNCYDTWTKSLTATVNSGTISVSVSDKTATYSGSAISPNTVSVTAPTNGATVKYGTAAWTYNLSSPQSYTNAWTYTIYYQVTAANYTTKTGSYKLTIIDNTPPTCTITEAACTSWSLRLTLTWSENLITPNWWNKTNDTTYWKDVTSNASVSVTVTDINWNTWTCSITPTHYDKTAPTTTASGVPSGWTWSNVTVILSANSNGCDSNNSTYYCIDTNNTCTPSTVWTSVSVTCAAWSKCTKYVRYYSKDGLGNTETPKSSTVKIDKEWPTFTFSNANGNECTAWTLTITSASDNDGVWLHSNAYKFEWWSWWTTTSTWITAQQPWSVIVTWYVRDSLGSETAKVATYIFNDVAPTANNITVNNVWTWKTVNWKILSSATEWSCWNGALSANLETNASSSMWICSINWDNISFVATWWASGSASCVIVIEDNEHSTKEITVTWNNVSRPIPQITFVNPTPAHNVAVTQNRFTTKMSIINTDKITKLIYNYNGQLYDLASGLLLMYNFDNVTSIWESASLVKDLSPNWNDWIIVGNGVSLVDGKWWSAYSFNGITGNRIEFSDYGSLKPYWTISLWMKWPLKSSYSILIWNKDGLVIGIKNTRILWRVGTSSDKKPAWIVSNYNNNWWNHVVVSNNNWTLSYYINWQILQNTGTDYWSWSSNSWSIWERLVSTHYPYSGYIDEVRVYNRALSQDEVQFLYKSNLKKTSADTWEFETVNTCLDATWTYRYSWYVESAVDTSWVTDNRMLTTNIPLVSVDSTWYDFWTRTASWSAQTINGTMWTLTVSDYLWNTWWLVYLATSSSLVWKNTNQTIDTNNLKFKANSLIYNWLYEWYTNTHVAFGNGISTTQYKTAKSSCAAWADHCASSSAKILEYMRRTTDTNDFMCWDVWTYSDNTQIQLEIPAWQIQDTYEWTLRVTLQDNYGTRQRWTWATIN